MRNKLEENLEENEQDRKARLRFGALGAIKWILGMYSLGFSGVGEAD
jgi:hypothetical protein